MLDLKIVHNVYLTEKLQGIHRQLQAMGTAKFMIKQALSHGKIDLSAYYEVLQGHYGKLHAEVTHHGRLG